MFRKKSSHDRKNALGVHSIAGKKTPVIQKIKQRFGLFKDKLHNGNTKLHLLVENLCSVSELNAYLSHIGEQRAIAAAKALNDAGSLPVDVIPESADAKGRKRKLKLTAELIPYTTADTLLPMDRLIDVNELLREYKTSGNKKLMENLALACEAVNIVRKFKLRSYTHPSANSLSKAEFNKLCALIGDMRFGSHVVATGTSPVLPHPDLQKLHIKNKHAITKGVGNCDEYASITLEYVRRLDSYVRAEIFNIKNGDHAFVVVGRNLNSDEKDFKTWGDEAVVCDAWAGSVFPASEMSVKLGDYKWRGFAGRSDKFSTVFHFNPKYHRLSVSKELPPIGKKLVIK
ncbi:MAG TPA: hypothetical protein VL360_05710 [Gammaproteobacteria bacterium]|jgi:hypothetical protein|nr:hypothetical protein [Gammaproteobacteria bacterium]